MLKSPKEVVLASFHYLAEIAPPTQKISEVRVEEVRQPNEADEKKIWLVVLSYDNMGDFPFDKKRVYKEFKVSDQDGSIISMEEVRRQ